MCGISIYKKKHYYKCNASATTNVMTKPERGSGRAAWGTRGLHVSSQISLAPPAYTQLAQLFISIRHLLLNKDNARSLGTRKSLGSLQINTHLFIQSQWICHNNKIHSLICEIPHTQVSRDRMIASWSLDSLIDRIFKNKITLIH